MLMKPVTLAAALLIATSGMAYAENVELRFSWWGGNNRHQVTLQAIKAFEQQHPEYQGTGGILGMGRLFIPFYHPDCRRSGAGCRPDQLELAADFF